MIASPLLAIRGTRIAHLVGPGDHRGGGSVALQLAEEQAAAGCPVVTFLLGRPDDRTAHTLEKAGIEVEWCAARGRAAPRDAWRLAAAFRRRGVALVHSHGSGVTGLGAWATLGAGIPHVVTLRGGGAWAGSRRQRLALRISLGLSAAVVTGSALLAEHLRRDLRLRDGRVAVIPDGVRPPPPSPSSLRSELGLAASATVLLTVGHLGAGAGHRHLVEALVEMRRQYPGLHLVIAGSGEVEAPLWSHARARGLGDRVHLLGNRDDLPNLLTAADVFVLPAVAEGPDAALLGAMRAGLPIVASDADEVRAALAGGEAGVLVRPDDPDALVEALRRLLAGGPEAKELGGRAARRAAAVYDVEGMVVRYAALYAVVLRRLL